MKEMIYFFLWKKDNDEGGDDNASGLFRSASTLNDRYSKNDYNTGKDTGDSIGKNCDLSVVDDSCVKAADVTDVSGVIFFLFFYYFYFCYFLVSDIIFYTVLIFFSYIILY